MTGRLQRDRAVLHSAMLSVAGAAGGSLACAQGVLCELLSV